jgi:hypothetical protein
MIPIAGRARHRLRPILGVGRFLQRKHRFADGAIGAARRTCLHSPACCGTHRKPVMHTPDPRCLLAATGLSDARPPLSMHGWRHALHAMSLPVWATILASLVGFGLLVGFQQIVAQSMVQGEQRRTATQAHDRSLWLCKLLPGSVGRDQCLAQLREAPESMPSRGVAAFVVNPQER